ncbi:MAG: aspartyl protease family protein [Bacteroidia bacterium]
MKEFSFEIHPVSNLIYLKATLNDQEILLLLDTGASSTIIDSSSILIAELFGSIIKTDELKFETANGSLVATEYIVEIFECLGIRKNNYRICAYDFISQGFLPDIDGMLGADFLLNHKICIDYPNKKITIQ